MVLSAVSHLALAYDRIERGALYSMTATTTTTVRSVLHRYLTPTTESQHYRLWQDSFLYTLKLKL